MQISKLKKQKVQNQLNSIIRILHISHTNISADNRILKEIRALDEISYFKLYGIGICDRQDVEMLNIPSHVNIISIKLLMRKLRFLPAIVRYVLVMIEMVICLFLRSIKVRPNIIHCHDTPVLLVGILLKCIFRSKLIYDAHELESNKNGQSKTISFFTLSIERLCWPFIDYFISVSPSIINWYNSNLGYKPNSLVLNSPLFDGFSKSQKLGFTKSGYFHEKFGIPSRIKVFLYLGLLVPGRGLDKILTIFSNSALKSHVVFMGSGPLSKEIKSAAEICERIHIHPPALHQDVVFLSKSADYGLCIIEDVSLSDYYCLPNKLFEYAFAGIPVLASNFPDISTIVNKHRLGVCCSPDSDSIFHALRRIERAKTSMPSYELNSLSWQNQSKSLKQAYHKLIGR